MSAEVKQVKGQEISVINIPDFADPHKSNFLNRAGSFCMQTKPWTTQRALRYNGLTSEHLGAAKLQNS
jgi:hypothetical protein